MGEGVGVGPEEVLQVPEGKGVVVTARVGDGARSASEVRKQVESEVTRPGLVHLLGPLAVKGRIFGRWEYGVG